MPILSAVDVVDYLQRRGVVAAGQAVAVRELTGGVSSLVLLVEPAGEPAFVLKQALPQLKVAEPWHCSVDRARREAAALRRCGELLAAFPCSTPLAAGTPRLLWEDPAEHLFAMAAAGPHATWKIHLLAGRCEAPVARAAGRLLATLHGATWGDREGCAELADPQFFIALRVEPYYRFTAARRPELAMHLERLAEQSLAEPWSLVHGDFSPKNLLVGDDWLWLVDFEVGHYGDPAFDVGFVLSHLVLKAIHAGAAEADSRLLLAEQLLAAYDERLAEWVAAPQRARLFDRAWLHLAGCLAARVAGKSPVEYLTDTRRRELVLSLAADFFAAPPADGADVSARVARALRTVVD